MSSVKTLHSHTAPLTPAQAERLRKALQERGYEFEEKPYMLFSARKEKLAIAVYEKGPKAVIQGKGIEDFITFVLEPEILNEAKLGYEEVLSPELFEPHFGIDESGKGDFFGPLVIAGVYMLRAIRDIWHSDKEWAGISDAVTFWRKLPYALLLGCLILFGCFPRLLTDNIKASVVPVVRMIGADDIEMAPIPKGHPAR